MIKPISISNQFVLKNQQTKRQEKENVEIQSCGDFSSYQVGQALKAQAGIGFKQTNSLYVNSKINESGRASFVPNENKIILYRPYSDEVILKSLYSYKANSLKDNFIALYTSYLMNMYWDTHIESELLSKKDVLNQSEVINLNNEHLSISFIDKKKENVSPQKARLLQDGMLHKFMEIDIKEPFGLIKDLHKEKLLNAENINEFLFLSDYQEDVFNLFSIIDSITEEDIKSFVKKYLINQEPVTIVNSTKYYDAEIWGKND